ncbi:vesicle coat component [Xylographa opegraphella]|nr:vesicle coat component [Xylographa opegraphella]
MEPLQSSSVSHESPGSWHPAWRPDTQTHLSNNEGNAVTDDKRTARQDLPRATAGDRHSDKADSQSGDHATSSPGSAHPEDAYSGRSKYPAQATSQSINRDPETGLGINIVPGQGSSSGEATLQIRQSTINEVVISNGIQGSKVHEDGTSQSYNFSNPDADVPLNVDWENDNHANSTWEVDPEIPHPNIQRKLNHTNSFPNVPPLQGGSGLPGFPPLPHSQVEDIMEGIAEVDAEEEHADSGYSFGLDVKDHHTHDQPFLNGIPFQSLNEVETRTPLTPLNEEARFEEGVPLLPSEFPSRQSQEALQDVSLPDYFDSKAQSQETADEDFFANVSADLHNDGSFSKPPQPDRKTTMQVLSSIQYPSRDEVHQNYVADEESPTFGNLTGGGIAVSASTITSQVLVDHTDFDTPERNDSSADVAVPKEDDLAALWQAALTDDEFLIEESSVDPSSFFDEDGEGFLNEDSAADFPPNYFSPSIPHPVVDMDGQIQGFSNISTAGSQLTSSGTPVQTRIPPPLYGQPTSSSGGWKDPSVQPPYTQSGFANAPKVPTGSSDITQQSALTNQSVLQRPLMPEKSQSFADKSKGGYTSPYDLPIEVSRSRKRVGPQQLQNINNRNATNKPPPPPPRSSSIQSSAMSPYGQTVYQNSPTLTSTPTMSPAMTNQVPSTADLIASPSQHKSSTGSFFEELPITSKARPLSSAGKFSAPTYQHVPPPPTQIPPQRGQVDQTTHQLQQSLPSTSTPQPYQLLAPERVLPYASSNLPVGATPQQQTNPNARYSPAPQAQLNLPLARNRYATPPVVPQRPPSVSHIFPHQPRTSSPLARSASVTQQYLPRAQPEDISSSNELFPTGSRRPSLRTAQTEYSPSSNMLDGHPDTTTHASDMNGPARAPSYNHPLQQSQLMSPDHRAPPSQNLEARYGGSTIPYSDGNDSWNNRSQNSREGSLDRQISPKTLNSRSIQQPSSLNERLGPRRSSLAGPNFMVPSDSSEHDPLERWKGCPVFNFGFGGHVVTSFPSRIPRYASGQLVPMIKCGPGEVHVRSGKIIPLEEHIADFPGPLRSKGKKKDVLLWLEKGIEKLGHQQFQINSNQNQVDPLKRHEERILLWKVLHVLIEYDGVLEANMNAVKAVRDILSPEMLNSGANEQILYESQVHSRAISRSSITQSTPDSTTLEDVETLRKLLIQGGREKAVWHAVDKKLWGHALLLASTLPKDLWKQATQEFIRSEVKPVGDNAESLAALYDVLTGSWEESVDKLVPPSARAGLQMISKTSASGPVKNALDGLDRWRETLSLILSNRSADDSNALLALGRLLANYGRIEAAHICYIFSKASGLFGGPDDPQASIALLGADHVKQPFDYYRDIDSILLTEIYEYAFAVLAPSSAPTVAPHLQAHKLNHALLLAEYGYRDEAQQYCDAVMNVLKATTKPSPYYHAQLFSSLDDLANRLRQAPKDGSSSWIPRPSMDKVSGSVWNRLNQFITGDDSDATSTGSGKGIESEAGPFAGVAGDTPSISRAQSPDLYGSYANRGNYVAGSTSMPQPPANARYAPGGQYTPHPIPDRLSQQMPESQRVGHLEALKRADIQRQSSYTSLPTLYPDLYKKQQLDQHQQSVRPSSATLPPEHENYAPAPSSRSSHSPELLNHGLYVPRQQDTYPQQDHGSNNSMSGVTHGPQSALHSPPKSMSNQLSPYGPRSGSDQPVPSPVSDRQHSASYEPRSASYEPRSYQPSPVSDKPLPPAPYSPPTSYEPQQSYEPFTSSYDPPSYEPLSAPLEPQSASLEAHSSYGYEPPSSSYDPPSYDPETQTGDTSPVQEKGKSRSYLDDDDDDDDLVAKAAALKKAEKAKKDREADEAFRKAAEADAQKDSKGTATKSGWFGWLAAGSKSKDPAAASGSSSRGPIRARLGEESSFVYDANLKKWVNKKAGAEAPAASAPTPPPPKGPPSRAVSAAGGQPPPSKPPPMPMSTGAALGGTLSPGSVPPSQGPSRNASPSLRGAASPTTPAAPGSDAVASPPIGSRSPAPGESAAEPNKSGGLMPASATGVGPPSAPPSRPATGTSNASSIDDLIGAPAARKGGTVKGKKKGRGYVDVMAK